MKLFNSLLGVFGMRHPLGLHDLDLLDETSPGDGQEIPVSSSELRALRSGTEASTHSSLSTQGVDGPPVQSGEASTGGHPNVDWDVIREGMASLRTTLVDALAWLDEIDPTAAGLAATDPPSFEVMSIEEFERRQRQK